MLNKECHAVLNEDLRDLLKSLCQLEDVENGNMYCRQCKTPISLNNIQFIVPISKTQFEFVCNKIRCGEQYTQHKGGKV